MSFEELKDDWDLVGESGGQNNLTNEEIDIILKSKYQSFIGRTVILEILILLVVIYFITLPVARFELLDEGYLEVMAILSLGVLGMLLVMRLIKLKNIFRQDYLSLSHSVAIKKIAQQSIANQKSYYANIILGFVLVIMLAILNLKIYNEYELIQDKYFWLVIIPSSLFFITMVNRWIRKYYLKAIREAEDLVRDLD